jgi:hypothetical protein
MIVIDVIHRQEPIVLFCCNPDPVGEPEVGEREGTPPQPEQPEKPREINPADFLQKTGPGIGKFPIYW